MENGISKIPVEDPSNGFGFMNVIWFTKENETESQVPYFRCSYQIFILV